MENVNNNNKNILPEKQNHDNNPSVSTYENHRQVIIGPSHVGKTYYRLNILYKIGNQRRILLIAPSPHQYPNNKTSIDIKPIR